MLLIATVMRLLLVNRAVAADVIVDRQVSPRLSASGAEWNGEAQELGDVGGQLRQAPRHDIYISQRQRLDSSCFEQHKHITCLGFLTRME